MTVRLLVAVVVMFMCLPWAKAQVYPIRTYSTESGMNNARVTAVVQDHDGFIWVATGGGVSRTDGRTFQNYTSKSGLAGDKVTCLAVDAQNRIWVGHQDAGISIIAPDTVITITERDGLVNNEVHALLCANDSSIWAGTFAGVTVFSGEKKKSFATKDGLASDNIRTMAMDAKGRIWLGTFGNGITIFHQGKFGPLALDDTLPNNHITDLHPKGEDMLIGTLGGAFLCKGRNLSTLLSAVGQVNAITESENAIWIGSFSGLARILKDATLQLNARNGIPHNEVLSLLTDREGNVWVGTAKGLACIHHLALAHFPTEIGFELEPAGLFKDSRGRLWAANSIGGVMRKEEGNFIQAFTDPDLNSHVIGPIAEDASGRIWFGTQDFGGLFLSDETRIYNYSDVFGLADNNINCMLLTKADELLIGTPSGLSVFSNDDFSLIPVSDEPATAHITSFLTMPDGSVTIGSLDGTISVYKDGEVQMLHPASVVKAPINSLSESPFGLLVATEGNGLFMLNGKGIRQVSNGEGLPDVNVRSVAVMGIDIYIGTSSSICRLTVGDTTVRVQSIMNRNLGGVIECRAGSVLKNGSVIWFGTMKGMVRLQTRELQKYAQPPRVFFQELQLFYRPVNWAERNLNIDPDGMPKGLVLTHDDNYLRFHFKALSLSDPEQVRYRWMLEGFEEEWTPFTTAEMANYPNLPPGTYTFKLIACTGDDTCVSKSLSFRFTIRPPIWKTLWFYLLVGVVVVALTYSYIKWRERKLKEEKRILETTVEERTAELREQKEIVEEQNRHITESIEYARDIQMAVQPSEEEMKRAFASHFVLYRPKETVGGDFYWVYTSNNVTWAAAVDCTGHGVAGAFMSMIGSDLLNQNVIEKQTEDPAQVLNALDKGIKLAFAQSATEFEGDKGMDIAIVRIDRALRKVTFAGAQRPLYMAMNGEINEIEGDNFSISCARNTEIKFTAHEVPLVDGMRLFLFSDGYADQFGGSKGKKLMTRQLKEIIISCLDRPMTEQRAALEHGLDLWKGTEYPQLDDILVMGIQL